MLLWSCCRRRASTAMSADPGDVCFASCKLFDLVFFFDLPFFPFSWLFHWEFHGSWLEKLCTVIRISFSFMIFMAVCLSRSIPKWAAVMPLRGGIALAIAGFAKGHHGQHGHGGHQLNGKVVPKGWETFAASVLVPPDLRPGDRFDTRSCSAVAGTCEGVWAKQWFWPRSVTVQRSDKYLKKSISVDLESLKGLCS